MKPKNPPVHFIDITQEGDKTLLRLTGQWTVFYVAALERAVDEALGQSSSAEIDASGIERLDTAGAWQLRKLVEKSNAAAHFTKRQKDLLDFLPATLEQPPPSAAKPFFLTGLFIAIGKKAIAIRQSTYDIFVFIGQIFTRFFANFLHPRHFRPAAIARHINETGVKALPIVGLLAILISMVIAYQASIQLKKFGANVYTIDLTTISLLREMGVLITAIMVAGRSGSAFAAEIGVMKLREEVDALKTIGLDPIEILVLPRLIALLIVLPLLAFVADIVGLAGGALMSVTMLGIPLNEYLARVQSVGTPVMFFVGMIKAPVFAFLIAIVGTWQGMNVSGSAESVGRLTTVAVVQSIFLVITADALFSIVFEWMGI